jgi:hypothetical protein
LLPPIDKEWKRTPAHLGPHRYTPLRQSLEFKTSAALLALLGGSLVWAHVRLRSLIDTAVLRDLAEALFCYQVDPLYLKPDERFRFYPRTDGKPLPEAALMVYPYIFFERFFPFPRFWPVYPQIIETARAIYLTEFIMSKRDKSYERWVETAIKRLNVAAPFPDCRTEPIPNGSPLEVFEAESRRAIGAPLGPSALVGTTAFDAAANRTEVAGILSGTDWSANPFLRSPEAMRAEGFSGKPYEFPG